MDTSPVAPAQNANEKMPTGMKVILVFFAVSLFFSILGLPKNMEMINKGSGSSVVLGIGSIVSVLLGVFILVGIYTRRWWRALVGLLSFNLLIGIIICATILATPFEKILELTGTPVPDVSPEKLAAAAQMAKIITAVPMIIGIAIAFSILLYIYKRRSYFKS